MKEHSNDDLLYILGAAGELGESSAKALLKFMEKWQVSAFEAVMECQVVAEQKVADILARRLNLPRITVLNPKDIDEAVLAMVPFHLAAAWGVMPVGFGPSAEEIRVMVADPLNDDVLAKLQHLTQKRIQLLIGERGYVKRSIEDHYPPHMQIDP